jgi:hypothetical protein
MRQALTLKHKARIDFQAVIKRITRSKTLVGVLRKKSLKIGDFIIRAGT